MSKRDQGASLTSYSEEGFAPEAVVNYLCLLGWSPKNNREMMPIKEVIAMFDLPQILRHNARFDLDKLHWLSGEYIREMTHDRFYELAVHALAKAGYDTNRFPVDYVKAALDTCKGKKRLLSELAPYAGFYFTEDFDYDAAAAREAFVAANKLPLTKLREAFAGLSDFKAAVLEATLKSVAAELGVKP